MSRPPGLTYGRAAMFGVLVALVLTVCAGAYLYVARYGIGSPPAAGEIADPASEAERLKRISGLLIILLIAALLILLFVIGCYLVIRVGGFVRTPLGGKPTKYVNAWQNYRLTDEQIAAATTEYPADDDADDPPIDPDARPSDPDSEHPTSEN